MRKCRTCGTRYEPTRPIQTACSIACALIQAKAARAKKEAKEDRAKKLKLKTRAQWMREAQAAVNAYVRKRDEHLPCVSCGTTTAMQWHAGHYRTTKAAPELRFDTRQIWKQCSQCNDYLSGNITEYRKELVRRIGIEQVEEIEGPHPPSKFSIENLKAIKEEYTAKLKDLQRRQEVP